MSSIIEKKTFRFSERIIKLHKYLEKQEYMISNQIYRSGTSIGANVIEAEDGESRADFRHKMSIALKECSETIYWLRLLRSGEYLSEFQFRSIYGDANEIKAILISIIRSTGNKP